MRKVLSTKEIIGPSNLKFAVLSGTGTADIVAAVAKKRIRIHGLMISAASAVNIKLQSNAAVDISGLLYFTANQLWMNLPFIDPKVGYWQQTGVGHKLTLNLSGSVAFGGVLIYTEV